MSDSTALSHSLRDAARRVAGVAQGKSLADQPPAQEQAPAARAALLDLTHGTLRRYGRVQRIVRALSRRAGGDVLVDALLWCSLYALDSGRYNDYTVVDQAVRACGLLEKWTAKGYVNAVLRGYLRRKDEMVAAIDSDPEARYQHPAWWIDTLRSSYSLDWERILAAGNGHPPMSVRVNRRHGSVETYRQRLDSAGIASRRNGEDALLLERPVPVDRLPGFEHGDVSVQDAGAQRAARCLGLTPGLRVLDACAAPGGKSAHALEAADISLVALDMDAARCARMDDNFRRLGLAAAVRVADCTRTADWWDGASFDRVLADVPCSASGIARRRPDLKWLRRQGDLAAFAQRQSQILDALWQVLAPGGKLLYVTCSVFPQENEDVVEAFAARIQGARRLALPDGEAAQWLPDPEHDGFYYALIEKQA